MNGAASHVRENWIGWGECALIFVAAFLVLLPLSLSGITIHDEGLIVTGADLVRMGKLPYRDFVSFYGPAQYYILAAGYALFGTDLLVSRLIHCTVLTLLVFMVFLISASACGQRHRWLPYLAASGCLAAVLASWPNANYPALPATVCLLTAGYFYGRRRPDSGRRDLLISSCMIGLAGLFRWDFGLYGLLALAGAAGIAMLLRGPEDKGSSRSIALCAAAGAVVMLVVYLPLLAAADFERWYDEILRYSLVDFAKYRAVAYIGPTRWQLSHSLRTGDGLELCQAAFRVLFVALPALLPVAVLSAGAHARRWSSDRTEINRLFEQLLFLAPLALLLLNQMRVRATLWQGLPAAITALTLIPVAIGAGQGIKAGNRLSRGMRFIGTALLAGIVTTGTVAGMDNWFKCFDRGRFVSLSLPRASGVRVQVEGQYYADLAADVVAKTRVGEKIYSGAKDHSRVFINDSLIYFVSGRMPATRFLELDPGLANTLSAQQDIIRSLVEAKVRIVVLLDMQSNENNLSSVSNNIHLLDDFIRANYEEVARYGRHAVFQKRGPAGAWELPGAGRAFDEHPADG